MEKSSRSALALAGAVNQFWWAPVWNAFAPAEVKTRSSPSKVWLFEGTWLYSLAISKIIVSAAVFGFPRGRACFHRRPFSRHIGFPGTQTLFPETLECSAVCSAPFSSHLFPWAAPSISAPAAPLLLTDSWVEACSPGQHCRALQGTSEESGTERWERRAGAGKPWCFLVFGSLEHPFQAVDSSDIQGHLPAAGIIPNLCIGSARWHHQ